MAAPYVFTLADVLEHLDYSARATGLGADQTLRRQCVRAAYREIVQARDWSFLHSNARIQLRAPQTTGTVAFDLTGGTYERQLTLTDATWPNWAEDASVRLGSPSIVCDVDQVKTSTVVTLDAMMAPIEDITSTTYQLYPRWYRLPNDFKTMARPMDEESWTVGAPVTKEFIEQLNRYEDQTGDIRYYAIGAPLDLYGAMALYVHPFSDADETLDIPYVRRPRDVNYTGHDSRDSDGTISVTGGNATVTGTSTAFASDMVGSILRISTSSIQPTGLDGQRPYAEQRSIIAVATSLSLTLDANVVTSRADVAYTISDPIDLDVVLYDAFLACCEKHLARRLRAKHAGSAERAYQEALFHAKEADCRMLQPQVAGAGPSYRSRLADSTSRTEVT